MELVAKLARLLPGEARQSRRRLINLGATLEEEGAEEWEVTTTDISTHGFRVKGVSALTPGASLILKLPNLPGMRAQVVWINKGEAGCAFDVPIHEADVATVLQIHRQERQPRVKKVFH